VVAEYHQAELDDLVARVGEAIDRYRAGDLDAFEVDQVLFQYSRAAKEQRAGVGSSRWSCAGSRPRASAVGRANGALLER
jgi:hypothetical protein